jgi:hypothetical protein
VTSFHAPSGVLDLSDLDLDGVRSRAVTGAALEVLAPAEAVQLTAAAEAGRSCLMCVCGDMRPRPQSHS